MKTALPVVCLLALTGCVGVRRIEFVKPVVIVVYSGDTRSRCVGIPWGDYVIMPAHTGAVVAECPETTTISVNGESLSIVGRPVFSDKDDWCLVRPSKPVAMTDIELFREPGPDLYIVKTPLDGDAPHLMACWPAIWRGESDAAANPLPPAALATQPTTGPWESGRPFGLMTLLLVAEPVGPGTCGSPVVFYDKRRGRFRVCGMVVGGNPTHLTLAGAIPFWLGPGTELLEKRQKAEEEAKTLISAEARGEKGGDQAP